jgi:hypothetical protein
MAEPPIDRNNPRHTKPLAHLRGMTEAELVEQHDGVIKTTAGIIATPDYYLNELARREAERQTKTMVRMTKWIVGLTIVIGILTAANVVLVASDDGGGTTTVIRSSPVEEERSGNEFSEALREENEHNSFSEALKEKGGE